MAYRTNPTAVRAITNLPTTLDITDFIIAASSIVDQVETCADGDLTDAQLTLIEQWLAAHMISTTIRPQINSKSIGGASESYSITQAGLNLNATPFGTQAMALDPTGCLVSIYEGAPSFTWLGGADLDD